MPNIFFLSISKVYISAYYLFIVVYHWYRFHLFCWQYRFSFCRAVVKMVFIVIEWFAMEISGICFGFISTIVHGFVNNLNENKSCQFEIKSN